MTPITRPYRTRRHTEVQRKETRHGEQDTQGSFGRGVLALTPVAAISDGLEPKDVADMLHAVMD